MAKTKISALTAATAITIGDTYSGVQGSTTKKFMALGFIPVQATYPGTMILGNGGASLDATGGGGIENVVIGVGAGFHSTVAKSNTLIGYNAGHAITSGWANTFIGRNVGMNGIGTGSLTIAGAGVEFYANTVVGEGAFEDATTASYNSIFGCNAGHKITTGINNNLFGVHSGAELTTGVSNLFIGRGAGYNVTTGSTNVLLGFQAGFSRVAGGDAVMIGYEAGYTDDAPQNNIYIGRSCGYYQNTGTYNTMIGYEAGKGASSYRGWYATYIGFRAGLLSGADSEGNVAIGYLSGGTNTTGKQNTYIGREAGTNASQLATATNSTAIGYQAYTTASNQVVIGNSAVTRMELSGRLVMSQISAAITDGTPSDAEIDTATGLTPATAGAGWQCTIKDNSGSGLLYRIESDGAGWYYSVKTLAT
jgi:hypothetical protein